MRAIVMSEVGGPEVLKESEIDRPEPKAHEVLIKVCACGVCGHDALERSGVMKRHVELPMVLGHEVAGEVVEVGSAVSTLKVGDRVATLQRQPCGECYYCRRGQDSACPNNRFFGHRGHTGGYAEYMAASTRAVVKLPDEVPYEQGAVLACTAGTILNGLRDEANLRAGETVLVTGAGGGLGVNSIKLAKLFGGYVIAQTTSEQKVDALRAAGADEVVVSRGAFHEEVVKLTDGYGIDVVVDNVGAPVFKTAFRTLAPYGRFLVVGQVNGDPVNFNLAFMIQKGIRMIGCKSTRWTQLHDLVEMTRRGLFTPDVGQVMPLEHAAEAHRQLEDRQVIGRTVLVP
jgi:acryloyl-coenzyme A reductase